MTGFKAAILVAVDWYRKCSYVDRREMMRAAGYIDV